MANTDASHKRLSTGNEFVSLPDISAATAGVEAVGFVHRGLRGCIELHGCQDNPLLKPLLRVDGTDVHIDHAQSELISYWVPQFSFSSQKITGICTIFAPLDRRGYVYALEIQNTSSEDVTVEAGWQGCWGKSLYAAKLSKPIQGLKHASISSYRPGVAVVEFRGQTPMFAVALATEDVMPVTIHNQEGTRKVTEWTHEGITASADSPLYCDLVDTYTLHPSETRSLVVYSGVGLDEVSAASSACDLRLRGWRKMLENLKQWLDARTIRCEDEKLQYLMNLNSFYNYFYAQGLALDTEDVVITSARSSASESCATYRDRDAMVWTMPAVLQTDWAQARKLLVHSFTTQLQNVGIGSRFIGGVVMESGLQLDQLCAPIIALRTYVKLTNDISVLFDRRIQTGVNTIQQILAAQRHPETPLFETLLLPSGEPSQYAYVCYPNVLVWRALVDVGWMYERIRDVDRADEVNLLADQVRDAIWTRFVVPGPLGDMFAHSVDLQGNHILADDAEGSLQMLTYHGFCSSGDPVYRNTTAWIHSEHNPLFRPDTPPSENLVDAPAASRGSGPSLLGVINDLLTDRKDQALDFLRQAELDNGIACETVEAATGTAANGRAFASCAGYLAFGLRHALNADVPEVATLRQKRRPEETLFQPPPEMSQDSKKARL